MTRGEGEATERDRLPVPVVLAAPSGTGKTTIAHALVERFDSFVFSVSATTRPPRGAERHGEDYEFVSRDEFERMVRAGDLVEWAEVHGNLYGTPARNLKRARDMGKYPVLDIDVQGARQIRLHVPDAMLIFIIPPSAEVLRRRLAGRGTEGEEELRRRMRGALVELDEAEGFDHVVVNEDLDQAVEGIRSLVAKPGRPAADLMAEVRRVKREIERTLERP